MTDNRATELLHELLIAHGVGFDTDIDECCYGEPPKTTWDFVLCGLEMTVTATEFVDVEGKRYLEMDFHHAFTPEQAIAATLGNDGVERSNGGVAELQAENAKLRELVWDVYCLAYPRAVEWEVADAVYDKYSPCGKCNELHGGKWPCASASKDMTEECCEPILAAVVADRMRALGIEVIDDD